MRKDLILLWECIWMYSNAFECNPMHFNAFPPFDASLQAFCPQGFAQMAFISINWMPKICQKFILWWFLKRFIHANFISGEVHVPKTHSNTQKTLDSETLNNKIRRNHKGETHLHIAAIRADLRRVQQIVAQKKYDIDIKDFAGNDQWMMINNQWSMSAHLIKCRNEKMCIKTKCIKIFIKNIHKKYA